MAKLSFSDVLRTTGASGQRKGLEPYDGKIVSLRNFKIEQRGRGTDKEGNPREKRRILTADVFTDGLKPRRALIPKRYAGRFMEAIELRSDEDEAPLEVNDVLVKVGEHGATLHDPSDFPQSEGGTAEPSNGENNGQATVRRGRKRNAESTEREPVAATA